MTKRDTTRAIDFKGGATIEALRLVPPQILGP
jgi:hypothetical protein